MTVAIDELTVLVWAPRGRDARLAAELLERNGLAARACGTAQEVADLAPRAGCAVLTEEALHTTPRMLLAAAISAQPAWSDFPVILFAPRGTGGVGEAIQLASVLGNVTILERPVQTRTLVSAAVSALRARRRQYEARAAIHRRDEFLAMLGHELRNPLAAMMLAIDAIDRQVGDVAARPRAVLARQAKHLNRLVEDLLDVARVTTGKVTLQRARVDLHELLGRCLQVADGQARARETTISLTATGEPAFVDADHVRLEEVFTNLLSNAIKYSPPKKHVVVALHADGNTCSVEVIDDGLGISPEMLPRVFDLFTQADATLDRSQGGLGIGLTLVKALVELHGGTVTAFSDGVGTGSRFRVELPRATSTPVEARVDGAPLATLGLRVVVVEDNPDLLELTCEALVTAGCEVMSACDGPSGLALLVEQQFDVAFVDIGLPGIDGYEVARRVREAGSDARMVAMSGYGQEQDRERALAAGFDLHLTKPVSMRMILQAARL
ncbi:MAG TPA: hybrid sensor histidine kinase/response regulator [Kofleriaceae bacterium]|nr:hybrid sensor histidine kinase/response regulator [Kofleriaceae bacterium]